MTDAALLEGALDRLKVTGTIEYSGEFGAEITTFIPFVCWLKSEGLLAGKSVTTYRGMRPYYYFLDDAEYAEKPETRSWAAPEQRVWPTNSTYTATRQAWHRMPDYRTRYRDEGPQFTRPILFIQNKFCIEWNAGPINYMPLFVLNQLFSLAGQKFDIVYSRPRQMQAHGDYTTDNNADCDYADLSLARRFPAVVILEDYCAGNAMPYNLTKLQIAAKSHLYIAVQGGGAHLLACFNDALMLLLHREGPEYPHAYASGPYKYLATPPPVLMVTHTNEQFQRGASLMANVERVGTRFEIAETWMPVLNEFRV